MPLTGEAKRNHSRANYLRKKKGELSVVEAQELNLLEAKVPAIHVRFENGMTFLKKV